MGITCMLIGDGVSNSEPKILQEAIGEPHLLLILFGSIDDLVSEVNQLSNLLGLFIIIHQSSNCTLQFMD
jgi:hypothetical protein